MKNKKTYIFDGKEDEWKATDKDKYDDIFKGNRKQRRYKAKKFYKELSK